MKDASYDVRVYGLDIRKRKRTTYRVRWNVARRTFQQTHKVRAQADSFRASLLTAARNGEAFSTKTGRPVSWGREENSLKWYFFSLEYMDVKWPYASPNHRRGIAEALTDATEALLVTTKGAPPREAIRTALRAWAYSARLQKGSEPPEHFVPTLRWLERNTVEMADFAPDTNGAVLARAVLNRLNRTQNGKQAAGSTATRKRVTFNNAMEYACERRLLPTNPIKLVKWTKPRITHNLDMRTVVNPDQARRLLDAVKTQGERGGRMVAFFAVMYYAALRPEEAVDLRIEALTSLPDNDGWGEMRLTHAEPRSGSRWTNNGKPRDRQPLKHRAPGEIRPVPIHPNLVKILRCHIEAYSIGPNDRLFTGPRGGIMTDRTYLDVWHKARADALTAQEAASPLAETPYALRHAAVSTWLSAGVPPAQVAEWAGHSVAVLLRVYAKCVAGQEEDAKRRITEATTQTAPKPPESDTKGDEQAV